jgi:AcrR family transcriptional regulator
MNGGLRERKKERTRLEISDTATALFAQHGFEQVTIAQVAEAAGVSKMTVTNYFPRKEDLVYDRAEQIIGGLAAAVRNRRPGESLLAAVRRDYAEAVARGEVTLGVAGQRFAALVAASPVLTSRIREIFDLREAALADQIAAEAAAGGVPGLPAGEAMPRLIAAQLESVHRVLYDEAMRRCLAGQPRAEVWAYLVPAASQAFGLLEPALAGIGARKRAGPRLATAAGQG